VRCWRRELTAGTVSIIGALTLPLFVQALAIWMTPVVWALYVPLYIALFRMPPLRASDRRRLFEREPPYSLRLVGDLQEILDRGLTHSLRHRWCTMRLLRQHRRKAARMSRWLDRHL
jgi:hypothetical protein